MNQIPYGCLLQFLRTGTSSFLIGKHRYINHKWTIFAMSAMTRASAEISAESQFRTGVYQGSSLKFMEN